MYDTPPPESKIGIVKVCFIRIVMVIDNHTLSYKLRLRNFIINSSSSHKIYFVNYKQGDYE